MFAPAIQRRDHTGHFSVHPAQQPADSSRRYWDDTVALKTPWVTSICPWARRLEGKVSPDLS
jgi:hypothetical protein